ncbi:hypothetical protein EDC01DRAFT_788326 [Geopyxis carbonaria]|nr:hypothetical protein EDC01DRAFT_788326 [Geopyxis carbonaria]
MTTALRSSLHGLGISDARLSAVVESPTTTPTAPTATTTIPTTTTTTTTAAAPTPTTTTPTTPSKSNLKPTKTASPSFSTTSTAVEKPEPPAERIIVGIDFGTTHSAVAWAHTSTPEEYEVITQWPGQSGNDWGKVPSDIAYIKTATRDSTPTPTPAPALGERPGSVGSGKSGKTAKSGGEEGEEKEEEEEKELGYKWGFEVSPTDPNKLAYIKILLDPSQPRPTFVEPKKTVLPKGKQPVDIVTDYLTALKSYTYLTLSRRLGRSVLSTTPVEYVLTVPAVWSDKARQLTLAAAVAAGLGDPATGLRLITEPEGAAEYALRSIRPNAMKAGDCFTVCDAGGGTVDLITYRIASLLPLQLNEVAVGTGALCGAVYLDRRFEDFVAARLGATVLAPRARLQMMQYWETYMKREFTDSSPDGEAADDGATDFWVPVMGVADSDALGIRGGFLRVTRAEVKGIFDPVITQVLSLLAAQVQSVLASPAAAPISAILLVGGFGSSEYLFQRITAWSGSSIPIMQPRNAWTAVVRGAIIRGLAGPVIQTRLSRRHYGVVHDARYDAAKHAEAERVWHELRCEWVVRNRVQWYIRRGTPTRDSRVISFPFYRTINARDVVGEAHRLRTELWVCDDVEAPEKRGPGVRKLCSMVSEPVSVDRFVKMRNEKGAVFYRVDYSLDMTVTGGNVVYEMSLEAKGRAGAEGEEGRRVGRVEVQYE